MSEQSPEILEDIDVRQDTAQEPVYRVIIHNDEVTPMDFVLHVLQSTFQLAGIRAVHVMYTAHYHGEAYVVSLPKTEAQRRVHQAHYAARLAGYPLRFTIERE